MPFIRGYSNELRHFGIHEKEFIAFVDALNVSLPPNAETQIVARPARIAGFFV